MKKIAVFLFVFMFFGSLVFAGGAQAQSGRVIPIPETVGEMPVVRVQGGQLRGYVEVDTGTYAFKGVQYAEVPERFAKPQPVTPWEGIKYAQAYGTVPPTPRNQMSIGEVEFDELVYPHRYWYESEECQFINIWTKPENFKAGPSAKKPVMFYIHGGTFTNGSAISGLAHDGGNLSAFGDVVVVTVNHRLNAFGYLDLSSFGDEYKDTAYLGQLDIIAALQWVKDNIAQFGGDPDNVLIFGQSGGCRKTLTLMHMPAASGLYHKAIGHSSIYNPITKEMAQEIGRKTVEILGLTNNVAAIKTVDYLTLMNAGQQAIASIPGASWNGVIDETNVLSVYTDYAQNVPLIMGTVFSEADCNNLEMITRNVFKNDWTAAQTDRYLREIRYPKNADAIKVEFAKHFSDMKPQDALFYDIERRDATLDSLVEKANSGGNAPVYNYLFCYEAPVNGGVLPMHCAELIYVFQNVGFRELINGTGGTQESYDMADVIAQAWVNFARSGNPSQPGLEWQPFDANTRTGTMIFNKQSHFAPLEDSNLRKLIREDNLFIPWDEIDWNIFN